MGPLARASNWVLSRFGLASKSGTDILMGAGKGGASAAGKAGSKWSVGETLSKAAGWVGTAGKGLAIGGAAYGIYEVTNVINEMTPEKAAAIEQGATDQFELILMTFTSAITGFYNNAAAASISLLGYLALFQVVIIGSRLVFNKGGDLGDIGEQLTWFILRTGFFLSLIGGMIISLPWLVQVLAETGGYIAGTGGAGTFVNPLGMVGDIIMAYKNSTPNDPISAIITIILMFITVAALFVLAYHYLMAMVEFVLVGVVSTFFLAFGVFEHTKDIAMKHISYTMGVGTKLMMLTIVSAIFPPLVEKFAGLLSGDFASLMVTMMLILMVLGLAISLSSIVSAAVSGSVSDSGKSFMSAVKMATGAGTAVAAGALAAGAMTGKALGSANQALGNVASRAMGISANPAQNLMQTGGSAAASALSSSIPSPSIKSAFSGGNSSSKSSEAPKIADVEIGSGVKDASTSDFNRGSSATGQADKKDAVKNDSTAMPKKSLGSFVNDASKSGASTSDFNGGSSATAQTQQKDALKSSASQESFSSKSLKTGLNELNQAQKGGIAGTEKGSLPKSAVEQIKKGGDKAAEEPKSLTDQMLDKSKSMLSSGIGSMLEAATGGQVSKNSFQKGFENLDNSFVKLGNFFKKDSNEKFGAKR